MFRSNDYGFGLTAVLVVILVLMLVGGAGFYVYERQQKTNSQSNSSQTGTNTTPQPEPQVDPYAGWKSYTSTVGGFSFKYPSSWGLSGFQGDNPVDASQMNGTEYLVRLMSNSAQGQSAKVGNFGVQFNVRSGPADKVGYDTYGNGTTTVLVNGLTLWEEKEQLNYATGPSVATCPSMQVGTDSSYSTHLPNGKYLEVYGSFCWAQGQTTAMTYSQQRASMEWKDAVNIIKSISFSR